MNKSEGFQFSLAMDSDQYELIGRITALSSFLDYSLEILIAALLGVRHQQARCISKHLFARKKLELVSDLIADHSILPKKAKELWKELQPLITEQYEARNDVVHGLWHRGSNGRWAVVRFTKRGGKARKVRPVSCAHMQLIAKNSADTTGLLVKFLGLVGKEIYPNKKPAALAGLLAD